jgi:predicted Fe-S protein YdhL (DUF1289 family)
MGLMDNAGSMDRITDTLGMSNIDNSADLPSDKSTGKSEQDASSSQSRKGVLRPDSPCAGYCSTSHGDEICKGCGRTFDEVINWIIYDEAEKDAIWARLEAAGLVKR